MTDICAICCDGFNKTTRKMIACGSCKIEACKACVSRYLLDSIQDAHCMGCKNVWSRDKLVDAFSASFVNKTYKQHRENVLLDREKSMLPETMRILNLKREIDALKADRKELRATFKRDYKDNPNSPGDPILLEEFKQTGVKDWMLRKKMEELLANQVVENDKMFFRGCPQVGCRGFIDDEKWECGLCDAQVCKDCNEILEDGGHKCNPDSLATAKLLLKDSKPCPKCATMIFKISGCDQMFCVQCKTAFSWRTRKVETGVIHNPHYFEMLRNAGVVPPRLDENVCGGMPTPFTLIEIAKQAQIPVSQLMSMSRLYNHIDQVELMTYRVNVIADNRDLRMKFIMSEINEADFKRMLQRREKKNQRNREVTAVLRLVNTVIADILTRFVNEKNKVILEEMDALVKIANQEFDTISKRYSNATPRIMGSEYDIAAC